MNINILEQAAQIRDNLDFPGTVAHTCREWWAYTNSHVVNQIDSGL